MIHDFESVQERIHALQFLVDEARFSASQWRAVAIGLGLMLLVCAITLAGILAALIGG